MIFLALLQHHPLLQDLQLRQILKCIELFEGARSVYEKFRLPRLLK
jgi:hypothetical protein